MIAVIFLAQAVVPMTATSVPLPTTIVGTSSMQTFVGAAGLSPTGMIRALRTDEDGRVIVAPPGWNLMACEATTADVCILHRRHRRSR